MEIEAAIILEMIGRPADYLKSALNNFIATMVAEDGIKITSKKIHEPKKIKESSDMFSTFAEIEIKCALEKLFFIVSKYMPSHIEILKPEGIKMTNLELSTLMTEFARRLHKYDEIAKGMGIKIQILENQMKRFQGNSQISPTSFTSASLPKEKKSKKKKL